MSRGRDCSRLRAVKSASPIPSATRFPTTAASPGRWRGAGTRSTCSLRASCSPSCRSGRLRQHDVLPHAQRASSARQSALPPAVSRQGLEYAPSARRLPKEIARLDPDVLHVVARPAALRPALAEGGAARAAGRLHGPRRAPAADGRQARPLASSVRERGSRRRPWSGAVEQLAELGVEREKIVRIRTPSSRPRARSRRRTADTLLFFGLIRRSKGLDSSSAPSRRSPSRCPACGSWWPAIPSSLGALPGPGARASASTTESTGACDSFLDDDVACVMERRRSSSFRTARSSRRACSPTALGHGRPAVVTDVGALGDTVRGSRPVRWCRRRIPRRSPGVRALLPGSPCRSDGSATALSWERLAEAHERLYHQIIRRNAGYASPS